ncbi:hypothetical protein Tco_0828682 [Tanacetum coccineum]
MALESGKLNHLVKDVRQRGQGNQRGEDTQKVKIINMIGSRSSKEKKRKDREVTEVWMNTPITFPSISAKDVSDEPLIVKVEVEGFAREVTKPLGKIELEVCFGNKGLCRRTTMKFTIIKDPSPYNVILGRNGLKTRLEKKQVIEEDVSEEIRKEEASMEEVSMTEEVLVNLTFPDQLLVIGGGLSETCKSQLKLLLKGNMEVFALGPTNMTSVPRLIIEHTLNINPSVESVCQKRRVLALEKSNAVAKEVAEWVKVGIVRPVKCPSWISNPVLVKKCDGA